MTETIGTKPGPESAIEREITAKAEALKTIFSPEDLEIIAYAFFVNGTPNQRDIHRRPPRNTVEMEEYDKLIKILDQAAGTKYEHGMEDGWLEK